MQLLREMMDKYMLYLYGGITYEEFAAFFRRKDCLAVQYSVLMIFLWGGCFVFNIPLVVCIIGSFVMLYGVILISMARTVRQQMFYSAVWAISTFLILCAVLLISVKYFGFEGF